METNYCLQQSNTPNFKAKMDISGIRDKVSRWKDIANCFEKKTSAYANDTFELVSIDGGIFLDRYNKQSKKVHMAEFPKSLVTELMKKSDEKVADVFKKLLLMFVENDKVKDIGLKALKEKEISGELTPIQLQKYMLTMLDKINVESVAKLHIEASKDPVFKNLTVLG